MVVLPEGGTDIILEEIKAKKKEITYFAAQASVPSLLPVLSQVCSVELAPPTAESVLTRIFVTHLLKYLGKGCNGCGTNIR